MNINLDEAKSILFIEPSAALKAEDFLQIATIIDNYAQQHGMLKGMLVRTKKFPGWSNLDAFMAHIKFVKQHHTKVHKIAAVTDSKTASFAKEFVGCFIKAQLKLFRYNQLDLAQQWLEQTTP